jgi:hypothetical protein
MQFNPQATPTKKVELGSAQTQNEDKVYFDPKRKPEEFEQHVINQKVPGSGLVPAWSASTLKVFETCRWRLYLDRVVKLQQEESEPLKRGNRYHKALEDYVMGTIGELPEEMAKSDKLNKFMPMIDELREAYAEGMVEVEGNWGFNTAWDTVDWMAKDVWARVKLDVLRWLDKPMGTHAKCVDWKTGARFGNEVVHADQGMIYTVATFMRYPQLELVDVEFAYVDQGETSFPQRYTREQAMTFLPRITDRATILTSARENDFTPSPSVYNCKKCPFNREEDGCHYRFIA